MGSAFEKALCLEQLCALDGALHFNEHSTPCQFYLGSLAFLAPCRGSFTSVWALSSASLNPAASVLVFCFFFFLATS